VITDFATITLTDANGDILCTFIKEKSDSDWGVAGKPMSKKQLDRDDPMRQGHLTRFRLLHLPDGRDRLDVPGPLLPWDANTRAALDRLHAVFGDMKITVDQLHVCVAEH
jgi:hypothetical protein